MNFNKLNIPRRVRHLLVDAAVGATVALAALTAAHAALPDRPHHRLEPAAPAVLAPAAALKDLIAFVEPVPGQPVISPFGMRKMPWEEAGRLHSGVDIAAPKGTPVLASADGVVVAAGSDGGYGRMVEIAHAGGLSTSYAHLSAISDGIGPGQAVQAGTPIGAMGSTGSSTGSHLHFEVRDSAGRPLNPTFFLGHRFASAGDLPVDRAARAVGRTRVAYVSYIPRDKQALIDARAKEKSETANGKLGSANETQDAAAARRALISRIASAQKSEMAKAEAQQHADLSDVEKNENTTVAVGTAPS